MNLDATLTQIVSTLIENHITFEQARTEFERKCITVALEKADGSVTKAARLLGVHRNTVTNRTDPSALALMRRSRRMRRRQQRWRK